MHTDRHRIAIIGAGISGLAAAALLKQQGRDVTIFEKFSEPKPLGSGLVLQQTGLAVLAHLNLDKSAIAMGAKLTHFQGKTVAGKTVFDLSHEKLNSNHFSLGVHRHTIFSLLYEKVLSLGIPIVTRFASDAVHVDGRKLTLVSDDNRRQTNFDLVVDASGTHSVIRDKYASIRYRRPFTYGALWGVCEDTGALPGNVLQQRFDGAKVSIGLIPIGRTPDAGNKQHVGFHWSIRNSDYDAWRQRPFEKWREDVIQLWGEASSLIGQFNRHDDLTHAIYTDTALKRFFSGRIVFIGDAAHSISPRLGQGANLGLVDALVLGRQLLKHPNIDAALRHYDRERKDHVQFYHAASRWLSLLFQSDSVVAPVLRDIGFGPLCKIPYMQRQMLQSLGGFKTGLFSALQLSMLHENYDLK